jgi:hypothetical protein
MNTSHFFQALACAACIAGAPTAFAAADDRAQQTESIHDANSLDENGAFSIGPARRPQPGDTVDPADLSTAEPDETPRPEASSEDRK